MTRIMKWDDEQIQKFIYRYNENRTALCVLWNMIDKVERELVGGSINHNPFSVIGNLRTPFGINWLIHGLYRFPFIDELVIWGFDGTRTGEAILSLWEQGLKGENVISGFGWKMDVGITRKEIDVLRNRVKLVDRRSVGKIKEVAGQFPLRSKAESKEKVLILPDIVAPDLAKFDSHGSGFHFVADDIFEAWLKVLNVVICTGLYKTTRKKEAISHQFHVAATFPCGDKEVIHKGFGLTQEDVDHYARFFFNPYKMPDNDYGYFERIKRFDGSLENLKNPDFEYDQWNKVIDLFKKSRDTKRGTIVLLSPRDIHELEDAPCFIEFTMAINNERLDGSFTFRSHDIVGGWPNNLFAITRMLRMAATKIGVRPGIVTVVSKNAQIYERNFEEALKILEKYGPNLKNRSKLMKIKKDPAGDFVFSLEKNKIRVKMLNATGDQILWEESDREPRALMSLIVEKFAWLSLRHILYLGQEMEKMQRSLKTGEDYTQG